MSDGLLKYAEGWCNTFEMFEMFEMFKSLIKDKCGSECLIDLVFKSLREECVRKFLQESYRLLHYPVCQGIVLCCSTTTLSQYPDLSSQ